MITHPTAAAHLYPNMPKPCYLQDYGYQRVYAPLDAPHFWKDSFIQSILPPPQKATAAQILAVSSVIAVVVAVTGSLFRCAERQLDVITNPLFIDAS